MPGPTIARETASEPALRAEVWRMVADGATTPTTDALAVEEPLEIHLNGWRWLVTMRTPGADADLVLGMLASEGVVARADDVQSIVFRRHPEEPDLANVVDVQLEQPLPALRERLARHAAVASTSCGLCGAASVEAILKQRPPVAPGPTVDPRLLATLPRGLAAAQPTFRETGGLHAAALFDTGGRLLAAREDVGRHNAVDKVIGWRLRRDPRPDTPILLVSGRASFEIIQKAHAAAIPIVAAVSAPSSLAVAFARDAGMTLVGFVRNGACNVYTGLERVQVARQSAPPADRDPGAPGADPVDFISRRVRAALDEIGFKISLAEWRALARSERLRLDILAGHAVRDDFAAYLIDRLTFRTGHAPRPLVRGADPA
jgi:formate dehydrogenase accessory protein FdhD